MSNFNFLAFIFAGVSLNLGPVFAGEPPSPVAPASGTAAVKLDFQALAAGPLPDELTLTDSESKFTVVADGDNRVLEMSPSPLVDGGVLLGPSIKGGCVVSARMKATSKRRSHPRFGIGLHGVSGYRCLVVPARKELQIVKDEEVVAQVPFEYKSGAWTSMEFRVSPTPEGGSRLEGRAWDAESPRPVAPQVHLEVKAPPGTGKASLWAAPYSELPIWFDDIAVTPGT
jgi:hypothetical protein